MNNAPHPHTGVTLTEALAHASDYWLTQRGWFTRRNALEILTPYWTEADINEAWDTTGRDR